MAADNLQPVDREYAAWLGDVEHRVILPAKWLLLVVCSVYWMWSREWQLPSHQAFTLFILFVGFTLAEQYFFSRDRITPRQVRPFVYGSFLLDIGFVTMLIILDSTDAQVVPGRPLISDFYLLFILAVLRGFALFRTKLENLLGFVLATVLFLVVASFDVNQTGIMEYLPVIRRLALLWGIMMIAQVFVVLVNQRKEEQIRVRERVVRSASLASLGELSAGVAHEINNPIGIIKTYVDYLEKSVRHDDPLREDFETIRKEAERCQEIVKRMLDFSNPQVQGFTSVDIAELVRESVAFVFHEGREDRTEAIITVSGSIPPIRGDSVQLKQAFLNILVNARQMVGEFAKTQAEDFVGRITIEVTRSGGPRPPVRITVRDNGPGIAPGEAERVFEPFFTRRHKGTGLGLAITRRIVEAHNGTIRLGPHPAGGAVVTIELPIEGEEEA